MFLGTFACVFEMKGVVARDGLTVVLFGTSLTASGKWEGALRRELRKWVANPAVINRAKNARGSTWGLKNIGLVTREMPNVVIMEFSMNDAREPEGISLARAEANIRKMLARLRGALPGVHICLMVTNPVGEEKVEGRPELEAYYDLYRRIAAEGAAALIDPKGWKDIDNDQIPDGVHPTATAHRSVTVPSIVEALQRLGYRNRSKNR